MKILLVRPPRIKQAITLSDFMFSEPIGLEMIYSLMKIDNKVEIFDMMVETKSLRDKLKEYDPEMVGLSSLCIDVNMVLSLAYETKVYDENIVTIVGGTQAFLNPDAFKNESIDHIFQYTDRYNLLEFLKLVKKGLTGPIAGILSRELRYYRLPLGSRNEYLVPDRESTAKYRKEYSYFGYKPAAIMEFGMGCEKACNFCLRWRIEGRKEKLIELDLIKKDLINIKEPTIMFYDNDFFASEQKIDKFIEIINELNISKNYIVYGSVKGIIEYKDRIKTLKELGLKAVLVGYESFSDQELSNYSKQTSVEDNYKASKILKELGLDAWASFMAHPDWDNKDFIALRRYIKGLNPEISSISPLTPFPNLPMYNTYKERLIYNKNEFERWSFGQVMIKPSKISLRRYYYELLITNLYVNLFINKKTEMINNYGLDNIFRLLKGSTNALKKYIALIIRGH